MLLLTVSPRHAFGQHSIGKMASQWRNYFNFGRFFRLTVGAAESRWRFTKPANIVVSLQCNN